MSGICGRQLGTEVVQEYVLKCLLCMDEVAGHELLGVLRVNNLGNHLAAIWVFQIVLN